MAGAPNRKLMSVEDAKLRILELGIRRDAPSGILGNPLFRSTALVICGALVGRLFRKRDKSGANPPLLSVLAQSFAAASPLLIAQLLKVLGTAGSTTTASTETQPPQSTN